MGNLIGPPKASYFFTFLQSRAAVLGVEVAAAGWPAGGGFASVRVPNPSVGPGEAALDLAHVQHGEEVVSLAPGIVEGMQHECDAGLPGDASKPSYSLTLSQG
jgi:hypothetical protein